MNQDSMNRLVSQLLTRPYIIEMMREVAARQKNSLAQVAKLRQLDVTSPVFWPFHAPQMPLCAAEAYGGRMRCVDGHEYIDCHMGWGAQALHGHNPPEVTRFVADALAGNTGNGYFAAIELKLVELLKELMPHNEKWALLNSGTDATSGAIRLCRAYTGRRLVAKLEGSLHGVHDLAAHNTAFWYHGNPTIPFPESSERGVSRVPALRGVPVAGDADLLILPHNDPRSFEIIAERRDELACVIAEPACSSFPFEDKSLPFVRKLSQVCRESRVPFILDEVLTGFRSGISGAAVEHDIPADLITYGKVITGLGLPLSAIGGRAELLDIAQTSGMPLTDLGRKTCLNTTHMASNLALSASYASLSLLKSKGEEYYAQTRAKVDRIHARLAAFREQHEVPLRLLGFGDFIGAFGFFADTDFADTREFAAAVNPIGSYVLTLMLRKRGVYTFSMPLFFTGGAHSDADIDQLCDALEDSCLEMKSHDFPFLLPEEDAQ